MSDTPDPFVDLGRKVDAATAALERDRAALQERLRAADRKATNSRRVGYVGVIVGLLGIVGAIYAFGAAHTAQDAVDLVNEQRASARVTSCEADNDTAEKINGLNDRNQDLLRNVFTNQTPRTDEQQQRIDEFLTHELAAYESVKVPARDCSPAGIEAFYAGSTTTTEAP